VKIDTSRIEKILTKLSRRDPTLFRTLVKKINQIGSLGIGSIEHFKNLRYDLSDLKRVRIGSFVLFRIKEGVIVF